MRAKYSTILFSCILMLTIFTGDITNVARAKGKPELEKTSFVVMDTNNGINLERNKDISNNTKEPEIKKISKTLVNIDIPTYTYSKPYEDGCYITDETSLAYKWISECEVDSRGHYMYANKYYAVAMGTYFDEVGSRYKVSLDSGKEIYVIKCDTKQDRHTTNGMIDHTGGMIEFIIDTDKASSYYGVGQNGYVLNGSFNNCDDFNGKIVKIEQIL